MANLEKEAAFELEKPMAQMLEECPVIPFGNRVVIIRNEYVDTGLIVLADTAKQKPTTGRVIGIGPDVSETFRLNQQIIFILYGGVPLVLKDPNQQGKKIEYLVLGEKEIMGELRIDPDEIDSSGKV